MAKKRKKKRKPGSHNNYKRSIVSRRTVKMFLEDKEHKFTSEEFGSKILFSLAKRYGCPGNDIHEAARYLQRKGYHGRKRKKAPRQKLTKEQRLERLKEYRGFYYSDEWLALRQRVLKKYGAACMKCGSEENIHIDHIKPRSRFKALELEFENLQVLCRDCNYEKWNTDYTDYRPKPPRVKRKNRPA